MTGRVQQRPETSGLPSGLPERWAPEERDTLPGVGWGWQAITGVVVLVLVTLHMIANHFVVQGGLRDYQQVIDYITNPVILPLETLFLVVVSWHGLLGLRAVIFDFGLSARAERIVTRAFVVVWLGTIVYGLALLAILVTRR
jgi:succinate dehydrogenase / fumarate reductase, membrane anchor subunit